MATLRNIEKIQPGINLKIFPRFGRLVNQKGRGAQDNSGTLLMLFHFYLFSCFPFNIPVRFSLLCLV